MEFGKVFSLVTIPSFAEALAGRAREWLPNRGGEEKD
jgi:hypothetical protein